MATRLLSLTATAQHYRDQQHLCTRVADALESEETRHAVTDADRHLWPQGAVRCRAMAAQWAALADEVEDYLARRGDPETVQPAQPVVLDGQDALY